MEKNLNFVTDFGKQHYLITMLEKRRNSLGKGEFISVIFILLSMAFVAINHNSLLAKLHA